MIPQGSRIHLIGIGGSGLSAIARILIELGYQVSGSDKQMSPITRELKKIGIQVFDTHDRENVNLANLVIRSSAIADTHVEVQAALDLGIPVMKRAEFLGELLQEYRTIAVAGTHGKTTTTSMIAYLLTKAGLDPSYVIGGIPSNLNTNAHAGASKLFVIEADEYDRMFLGLCPEIAVITNVEHDHPDCYPTKESFFQSFEHFVDRIIPNGTLIACTDDDGAARLVNLAGDRFEVITYCLDCSLEKRNVSLTAKNMSHSEIGLYYNLYQRENYLGDIKLQIPGKHNLLNSLAAVAVGLKLKIPFDLIQSALSEFKGVGRRFEQRGQINGIAIIDDYAHHPSEIRSTLAAARAKYPTSVLWTVWQPHTFSRLLNFWDGYLNAFENTDHLIVTDVYGAREGTPNGFSMSERSKEIPHPSVVFISDFEETANSLISKVETGDVVIILSAGDADQIGAQLLKKLSNGNRTG